MSDAPQEGWQISAEGRAWHIAFADAVASKGAALYASFMHETCSVQINNAMPVYSKLAIGAAYAEYIKAFRSLTYELLNVFGNEQQSVAEALFTCNFHNGGVEVVQHGYVLERNAAGLLPSARIYGDNSRILKPFMAAND